MNEHLFFSVKSLDEKNQYTCNYMLKSVEDLVNMVNLSPGYLYIHSVIEEKYFQGKIKRISFQQLEDDSNVNLEGPHIQTSPFEEIIYIITNGYILLIKVESFNKIDVNDLKQLYARTNKKYIGAAARSIYSTRGKFIFSRPILAQERFESKLAKKILPNYFIVPEEDGEPIYASIFEEDDMYMVSLMNEHMINMDYSFVFSEGESDNDYRPYFYEFILEDDSVELLSNLAERESLFEVQLKFRDDKKPEEDKDYLSGFVQFSASPPRSIPSYIKFLKKDAPKAVKEKMEKTENEILKVIENRKIYNKGKIKDNFKKVLPDKFNIENITLYDVGQGNWSKIRLLDKNNKKFDIVFDIGITNAFSQNPKYNNNAKLAVKELSENYIFILSHWDQDHIKGIIHLEKVQLNTTWIVPNLVKNQSQLSFRLAIYLVLSKSINSMFISEKLNGQAIFSHKGITLAKGKGDNRNVNCNGTKTKYNNKNNLGLILALENNNKKALLSGDCEYIQMPNNFLSEYNFMVASHHGAETNVFASSLHPGKKSDKLALFTVNSNYKNERKSYPKYSHKRCLECLGYKTDTTNHTRNKPWYF